MAATVKYKGSDLPDEVLLEVLVAEREPDLDLLIEERETLDWFHTLPNDASVYVEPEVIAGVLISERKRERERYNK